MGQFNVSGRHKHRDPPAIDIAAKPIIIWDVSLFVLSCDPKMKGTHVDETEAIAEAMLFAVPRTCVGNSSFR